MTSEAGVTPAVPGVTRQTLCENEWVSLKIVRKPDAGVGGYVYSHETRCRGRIVAILPYRDPPGGREYLVKSEMTPCWGFGQVLSAITGGYEGGGIEDDAVREMLEETGYAITVDDLIPLGESYASKSADTVYSLFSVDLTGREAGEAIGDGTRVEAESAAVWLTAGRLADIMDPQVAVMYVRLSAVTATEARWLELENAITWGTSCLSCARVLDMAAAETFRAEAAKAETARLKVKLADLDASARILGKIITGNSRAMEAARIELAQGSAEKAMQWILNSLPDVWDDPETEWDGKESANEWWDRTDVFYREAQKPVAGPAPMAAEACGCSNPECAGTPCGEGCCDD